LTSGGVRLDFVGRFCGLATIARPGGTVGFSGGGLRGGFWDDFRGKIRGDPRGDPWRDPSGDPPCDPPTDPPGDPPTDPLCDPAGDALRNRVTGEPFFGFINKPSSGAVSDMVLFNTSFKRIMLC